MAKLPIFPDKKQTVEEEKFRIQVRDLRNGDWFWINKQILEHKGLNASDKLVYSALAFFANETNQKCYPSIPKLTELTTLTRPTIIKSLKNLEENRLIRIERKKGKVSVYYLLKTYQLKNLTSQKEELHQLKSDTTPVKNSNPNNLKEQSLINNNIVVKNFKQLMKTKAKLIEKLSMSNKTRNF
jgi:alpha-N-acetylglucosamine transferase